MSAPNLQKLPSGYVDVPRYLYDAMMAAPNLSSAQRQVIAAVVRLTWGYHRDAKWDGAEISRQKIANLTGLSLRTVNNVVPPLIRAGVLVVAAPHTGRRAATIRLNHDPAGWGRFRPEIRPDGYDWEKYAAAAAFLLNYSTVSTLDYSTVSTLRSGEAEENPPDISTQGTESRGTKVLQRQYSTASPDLLSCTSLNELPLQDAASSADALPASCEHRRSFDLPGYGPVFEHDTWALGQPDSRALYLATFGEPSGNGKDGTSKRGQPAKLVPGDPLPGEVTILPTPEDLRGCAVARLPGEEIHDADPPDDGDDDPEIPFVSSDLLERAAQVVVSVGAASSPLIAARCGCDSATAEATLAALEAAGVVGPPNGGKARAVLAIP